MKVLVDEDVPEPSYRLLTILLSGHFVRHVNELKWKAKTDITLFREAPRRGFQVFITQNTSQLDNPDECSAIKRSGLHHVSYERSGSGLRAEGLATAALCATIPAIMADLEIAPSQRVVRIKKITGAGRYDLIDPTKQAPSHYWP